MLACIIGTVKSLEQRSITLQDRITKQEYVCESEGDDLLELKIGDQGVFIGQYVSGTLKVKRMEIRKFLDPLYESDLYDASGKFNLIPVINDPFTDIYLEFMEELKANESIDEDSSVS